MSSKSDDGENKEPDHLEDSADQHDTSSEAAGIVRGISRSLQSTTRAIAKLPTVGRIPRRAVFKRRLPVKRVANVSDRIATGLDYYSSAIETGQDRRIRISRFLWSIAKNTLLGAAVFETYERMVTFLAPQDTDNQCGDNFARASRGAHFQAGAAAGIVHAIAWTLWETKSTRILPAMSIHHAVAHSLLFGSFETIKRVLLEDSREDEIPYFVSVAIAGGFSGQIQHLASHYTEQWLRLTEEAVTPRPFSRNMMQFTAVAPAMRPFLWAFPPSAISFIAFEYGKSILGDSP